MRIAALSLCVLIGSTAFLPGGFGRDPEPLEQYRLQDLVILWTDPDQRLAKIRDPRGLAHLVTLGSRVGELHGEVVHIGAARVMLLQVRSDDKGSWSTRTATLNHDDDDPRIHTLPASNTGLRSYD